MARGVNKVILVGTCGKDPEMRGSVCTLSVATNETWTDKASGQKQERTEWHRVKFFGRTAEIASEYLRKGKQVYIEGKLRTEKYTDKEGIERQSTDIVGDELQLLGGAGSSEESAQSPRQSAPARQAAPAQQAPSPATPKPPQDFDDDFDPEIPF